MGLTRLFVSFLHLLFVVADLPQTSKTNADPTNSNYYGTCKLTYATIEHTFEKTGNCTRFSLLYVNFTEPSKELFASISDGVDVLVMTEVGLEAMDLPHNLKELIFSVQPGSSSKIIIAQNSSYKLESILLINLPLLPANIDNLRSLKSFSCENTHASNIDLAVLAKMTQLEVIHVKNSTITAYDSILLPSLRRLAIENGPILLSNVISCELPQLRSLHLLNNNLTVIPEQFSKIKTLKYFISQHNNLPRVTVDTFADMKQLEVLQLNNNRISELTTAVKLEFPRLDTLDIRDNELTQLDTTLWVMPALESLKLDGNQLKQVSGLLTLSSAKLKTVLMDENPWDCEWLVETVMKMPGMQIFSSNDSCYAHSVPFSSAIVA